MIHLGGRENCFQVMFLSVTHYFLLLRITLLCNKPFLKTIILMSFHLLLPKSRVLRKFVFRSKSYKSFWNKRKVESRSLKSKELWSREWKVLSVFPCFLSSNWVQRWLLRCCFTSLHRKIHFSKKVLSFLKLTLHPSCVRDPRVLFSIFMVERRKALFQFPREWKKFYR